MMLDLRTPRRILMTTDTVGGVWTYVLELARSLRPYGVNVTLATMGAPLSEGQRAAAARRENVDLHESRYRMEWMDDPWADVKAADAWLLNLEAQVQPDLIHLNNYAHGALAWEAPVLVVGHSCVFSWFAAVKGEPPDNRWQRYRRAVTRGLRAANYVAAPTETMLRALRAHYGPFQSDGIVYNGRKGEAFRPRKPEPFILSAGRIWDEGKNMKVLERAAPRLPWPVYVAGPTRHPNGGRIRLEHVTHLGELPSSTLATWMGRASIFALPARYEPFGLTALEAGLAGCALVLGDIPSLREVWGDAACFVPPDDGAMLAAMLQQLADDGPLRHRMAHRAREKARTYTSQRMARGYLACYDALLRACEAAVTDSVN